MAQDNMLGITQGLFGVAPSFQQEFSAALPALRGMSATDIGTAAAFAGGRQLGRGLMGAAGVEDPEMASANRAKQIAAELQQQGVSMQSSQGMKMLAQKLSESGDFRAAQAAAALAANFEQQESNVALKQAQTQKITMATQQEEQLRNELAALGPNPTQQQIMAVVTKYGDPTRILSALQASQDRQDRLQFQREQLAAKQGEEGGAGQPGPVGKSGGYRDINGVVYGATEMKNIRQEFEQAQKLMTLLNDVTATDIKNAKSPVDWTTKPSEAKVLASSKTLSAQTKLAAAQLIQQIESLPPGSASNADMQAAMKDFPGYSDDAALANWVNRTKTRLQNNIDRLSDNFGFKPRVTSSGAINLKSKPGSSRENPIKLD